MANKSSSKIESLAKKFELKLSQVKLGWMPQAPQMSTPTSSPPKSQAAAWGIFTADKAAVNIEGQKDLVVGKKYSLAFYKNGADSYYYKVWDISTKPYKLVKQSSSSYNTQTANAYISQCPSHSALLTVPVSK